MVRRLRSRGVADEVLVKLERDASRAGVAAPFLDPTAARERVRALWREAFELLMKLEALERAVESTLGDMGRDPSASAALMTLKAERDHLRKLVNSDWANPEGAKPTLPH